MISQCNGMTDGRMNCLHIIHETYNVDRFVFHGIFVLLVELGQGFIRRPPEFSFVFADFQEARLGFL